jgi:translocation-and-assembly-module (TAM) inner membrane subunit TamB-like protein
MGCLRVSRARHPWLALGRAFAWTLVFVCAASLGLVLHANVPALRSAFGAALNRSLAGSLRGRIELQGLERVGVSHASIASIAVLDEQGQPVLMLEDVALRFRPLGVIQSLIGSSEPLRVDHVRVDRSRVVLRTDPTSGDWTLLTALSKAEATTPREPRQPRTYAFPVVELGQVQVSADHPSLGHVEARLQRVRGELEVAGENTTLSVQRFGMRLVQNDDLVLNGTGSLQVLHQDFVAGAFHGFADGTELDASAELDRGVLNLRLDIPSARPEDLRRRLPDWPVTAPVAARLSAHGPMHALQLTGQLSALGSSLELTGSASLSAPQQAHLTLTGHALDARLYSPDLPVTAIEARGDVQLTQSATGLLATIELQTDPTRILDLQLPSVELALQIEASQAKAEVRLGDARGNIDAEWVRMPTGEIELRARLARVQLRTWPELGQLRGRADLGIRARISEEQVRGTLDGEVSELVAAQIGLAEGRVKGTFQGLTTDLGRLAIDASISGKGVRLGPLAFDSAQLSARGPWQHTRIAAELVSATGKRSSARGLLSLEHGTELEQLELSLAANDLALQAQVSRWSPARGVLSVEQFRLSGKVGTLTGRGRVQARGVELWLDADGLDSGLLARSLGFSEPFQGLISGHGELRTDTETPEGKLTIAVKRSSVRGVALGSVDLSAELQGRKLAAELESVESPLGRLSAQLTGELAGPALTEASWRQATFQGSAVLARVPLWPVGLVLAQSSRVKDLDGHLNATLQFQRTNASAFPSLLLQAGTEELSFSLASLVGSTETLTAYAGYALQTSASIDGQSGHAAANAVVTDAHGELLTSESSLDLDLLAFLADPRAILLQLLQTPIDALVRLHPRPLALLPPFLGVRALSGSVEAMLRMEGSVAMPTLTLTAQARQVLAGFAADARAVDLTSVLQYAPLTGQLLGHVEVAHAGTRLVSARVEGKLPNPLLETPSWATSELRAAAMLNGVPLELWPAAARQQIQARLYGSVDVTRRGAEQTQRAQLQIRDLSSSGEQLGSGRFTFESQAAGTRARLRIGSRDRYVLAELRGPSLQSDDSESILLGSVVARRFSAASLSPLLSGVLSHLGGEMDADLKFTLRPRSSSEAYLGIDGKGQLTNGTARLDALGLDVRELTGTLVARSTPDYTVIQIDPVSAKSASRTPNLSGDAELWLRGFRVVNGEANLSLNDVPLSLNGSLRGSARGDVRGRLERRTDHMFLEVKLPSFRIKLPASSARQLIALSPNPDVNVLQIVEEEAPAPGDALLWKIVFEFGDAVRLQRADLDVPLTGQPRLEYQHELRPSGTIEARPGGRITLFDQSFSIDRGIVELMPEEPDNPRVDLTASWRAPDGTSLYVDVTGRAKQANVTTRDDRGLDDVERLYLITGGSSDTQSAELGDGSASEAAAIGQTFALGINQFLRESLGNVAVSVSTTEDDRARYSASVRLTDKLSFQGNFRPASASNPEQSTNDLTGTLDYRFTRRWSVRTELGTSGGAFDLLWSHRY